MIITEYRNGSKIQNKEMASMTIDSEHRRRFKDLLNTDSDTQNWLQRISEHKNGFQDWVISEHIEMASYNDSTTDQ